MGGGGYTDGDPEGARAEALTKGFEGRFGAPPDHLVRAPGRVNLIGEHVDYEGYSVLPMAIKLSTLIAVRKHGEGLVIANVNPEYQERVESVDPAKPVDKENHSWVNYFLAGYKGVFEELARQGKPAPEAVGLQIMVDGRVPAGSGLSSSSAFVVASAMAVTAAYGIHFTKLEVAEFTRVCEQHVGTMSGGMDQAISVMGEEGVAKLIDFNPVKASDVKLPASCTFVIANSLTVSKKAETAAGRYNLRVLECMLAATMLGIKLGKSVQESLAFETLKDVEGLLLSHGGASSLDQYLHSEPYTVTEVEAALGKTMTDFIGAKTSLLPSVLEAEKAGGFKLLDRAKHVYSESQRVFQFKALCDGVGGGGDLLVKLGALMNDSHHSCSSLYECSSPELETLVALAKEHGALGARLTGAGWGGCMVALVEDAKVESYIAAIKTAYYGAKFPELADLGSTIFASKPSAGAAVLF